MLERKKTVLHIVVSYAVWLVLTCGIVLLLLIWRTALLAALADYAARGFFQGMRASAVEKAYYIFGGAVALGFCIALEVSLVKASDWTAIAAKSLRGVGVELLLIGLASGVTQVFVGTLFASVAHGIVLVLPLLFGGACIAGSTILRTKDRLRSKWRNNEQAHHNI